MRIVFISPVGTPLYARALDDRALGGTETGVIRVAEELSAQGHFVRVLTQLNNPPLSTPLYLPLSAHSDLGEIDLLISVREWSPLFLPINAKRKFFWTGDAYDQVLGVGIGDARIAKVIDSFLAVSAWHADTTCHTSGFPRNKAKVIGNGVKLSYFEGREERARKRLIYSSTPYRGLASLPSVVTSLRRKHPELELHVFSGFAVYEGSQQDPAVIRQFEPLFTLLKNTPGCFVHGNVTQKALAREFMKSSILAYPNTFAETSCITAMEAQAAGCAIVTSHLGALPETVGDSGILLKEKPGSPEYLSAFTNAVDLLLNDDALWKSYSDAARARARSFDWSEVARRIIQAE